MNSTTPEERAELLRLLGELALAGASHRSALVAARLVADVERLEQERNDLLARIHRDGGHHSASVGDEQSITDAHQKVVGWLTSEDEAQDFSRMESRANAYYAAMQESEAAATAAESALAAERERSGRLVEALREMLASGAHDGPCDNADDPDSACSLHLATSEGRRAAARAALSDAPPAAPAKCGTCAHVLHAGECREPMSTVPVVEGDNLTERDVLCGCAARPSPLAATPPHMLASVGLADLTTAQVEAREAVVRREALEEAAKVCERLARSYNLSGGSAFALKVGAENCADRIRDLRSRE